jgi:hypothetical protein
MATTINWEIFPISYSLSMASAIFQDSFTRPPGTNAVPPSFI